MVFAVMHWGRDRSDRIGRPRRGTRLVLTSVIVMSPMIFEVTAASVPASAVTAPTIYVANAGDPSSITAINTVTGVVEKSIPVRGGVAVNVDVAPHGSTAYAVVVGNDEEGSPGVLIPIDTATNTTGKAISVGTDPQTVGFNPNGKYAYVVDGLDAATTAPGASGIITPVNLAEGVAGQPIKVGPNPGSIAVTPDGQHAYVTDSNPTNGSPTMITPIDLDTNTPGKAIHVAARAIAISLNGESAFALGLDDVVPIDTTTNKPGKAIELGGVPQAIALAPDGQTAWVLSAPDPGLAPGPDKVTLTAINTATDAIGKVISLTGLSNQGPFFVGITPNGAHIYVLGQGSGKSASTVIAIDAGTDVASKPIKVGIDAGALAFNPNSQHVYVLAPGSDYQGPPISPQPKEAPGTVTPIATAMNTLGKPIKVGLLASAIAITP
jgi:DNA-binding beta-propeller fold protein YncE